MDRSVSAFNYSPDFASSSGQYRFVARQRKAVQATPGRLSEVVPTRFARHENFSP